MTHPLFSLLRALPSEGPELARAAASVDDWLEMVQHAVNHGLAGVLFHHLRRAKLLPAGPAARALEAGYAGCIAQSMQSEATSVRALAILGAEKIPAAPLKGVYLGDRLYPERFLRASGDADLLIRREDLPRAWKALEREGFGGQKGAFARYQVAHHHHLTFIPPGPGAALELHFEALRLSGGTVPATELMERSSPRRFRGQPMRGLDPEDELLHLAAHAAGHAFLRLCWLYDLKLFLLAHPKLDERVVADRARAFGVANAVAASLLLLAELDAPDVERFLGALAPNPARLRVWRAVLREQPLLQGRVAANKYLIFAWQLGIADSPPRLARFFGHIVFRVAKRRAHRYFRGWVPDDWAG